MLLQFSIQNFRSICDRQVFSMASSKAYKELEENTFDAGVGEKVPRLLKSAVLYGPNAAGKSTLVRAISLVENMVLQSAKESQANDLIDVEPFRLGANDLLSDSEFEVVLIEDGVRYQFGFRANRLRVTEEWLFAYPEGHEQKWYHRVFDPRSEAYEYKFSRLFEGGRRREDWKDQTRQNALFISTAVQLNNEQLRPVYSWFRNRLVTLQSMNLRNDYTVGQLKDPKRKSKILEFLGCADLFISDVSVETKQFDPGSLPRALPEGIRDELVKRMQGQELSDVQFIHKTASGDRVAFNEENESAGTLALFAFAGPWVNVLETDRVLVIDELDTSLHPAIVHQMVRLLHHNAGKAQVIFTTHDTSILSQKIMRRDQIWFVEKDKRQVSQIYPLSSFSVRENEALERGYLEGRYGAIPLLSNLNIHGLR